MGAEFAKAKWGLDAAQQGHHVQVFDAAPGHADGGGEGSALGLRQLRGSWGCCCPLVATGDMLRGGAGRRQEAWGGELYLGVLPVPGKGSYLAQSR